jgi:beta-N-acetylglucosaminidase
LQPTEKNQKYACEHGWNTKNKSITARPKNCRRKHINSNQWKEPDGAITKKMSIT